MALHGTKALEAWCRRVTQNYTGVNIVNMTTSWRNGLGFCAIIHHHCPHLIDFERLDPDDVFGNNELAFQVAEQHLGVPSLLDPQDMVECELLDRLSILTYLAQYFQAFHSQSVQTRVRRLGSMSKSSSANSDISDGGKRLVPTIGRHSEPCRVCNKSVFILERLNVGGRILHRTCFLCARCGNQLSLAGYYETETGEYCCELCPDEEHSEEKHSTLRADGVTPGSDEVDSGHSSEDYKDLDEEEHKAQPTLENRVEDPPAVSALTDVGENVFVDPVANSSHESGDHNANVQPPEDEHDICSNLTKPSIICSEDIDENDNTVDVEDIPSKESVETIELFPKNKIVINCPTDVNPFGDDDDELESNNLIHDNATGDSSRVCAETLSELSLTPQARSQECSPAKQSLNPFGSDAETDEEETGASKLATPAQTSPNRLSMNRSLTIGTMRANLNPFGSGFSSDEDCSQGSVSPSLSIRSSATTKKKRRAPLPPGSTPNTPKSADSSVRRFPVPTPRTSITPGQKNSPRLSTVSLPPAETAKRIKDENNMNRRSQIMESIKNEGSRCELASIPSDPNLMHHSYTSPSETASMNHSDTMSIMSTSTTTQSSGPSAGLGASQLFSTLVDKSDEGQWRKKKGPAPPRPIPPKRSVKKLHRKAINQELEDIEVRQGGLERQGVKLEKTIREICDKNDEEGENRDSLGPEAEDLIIQLFDLVNEKNELFRRQTELIYMKKDNWLQEQHADLEYQIRILMSNPEGQKTEEDKVKEEKLIKKLVEVVGLRNEIVDCLEMDRLRERDEDTAIEDHMSNYAAVKPVVTKKGITKMLRIKKKKKKDKDSEKDIDTSELAETAEPVSEEKKKKSAKKKILKYATRKLNFSH